MQDFRKLEAWQRSHSLVLRTYTKTASFPKAEMFGLTSQKPRSRFDPREHRGGLLSRAAVARAIAQNRTRLSGRTRLLLHSRERFEAAL